MKKFICIIFIILLLFSSCAKSNLDYISKKNKNTESFNDQTSGNILNKDNKKINTALNRGNILKVGATSISGDFNPILVKDSQDQEIVNLIFDGLISIDKHSNIKPNIAKSWSISDDKLTYTFNLKKDINFHNGEVLTAKDVEFTLLQIANANYNGAKFSLIKDLEGLKKYQEEESKKIKGIKIIDDYTIKLKYKKPSVRRIYDFQCGILSKSYYETEKWEDFEKLNNKPIGTGPMIFQEMLKNEHCILKTNTDYHLPINIDGVVFKIVPADLQVSELLSGEIDMCRPEINLKNYEKIKASNFCYINEYLTNGYRYIGFNLRDDRFSNKKVRQALAYGLKLDNFIETEWNGFAHPCYSPISSISWAAVDINDLNKYKYNLKKAQKLLKEAGWTKNKNGILTKDGKEFKIIWTIYKHDNWSANLMALAKNNWGALGIKVDYEILPFKDAVKKIFDDREFDIYSLSWELDYDPDPYDIFHSDNDVSGGFNSIGFNNEKSDKLIEKGREIYDKDKRIKIYQKWSELINDEVPYIFVSMESEFWGINSRVNNLEIEAYNSWGNQIDQIFLDYKDSSINKEK